MNSSLESLAWRWVRWNELIEMNAPKAVRVQVEDRDALITAICDDDMHYQACKHQLFDDPTYNAKKKAKDAPEVKFEDLGAAEGAVRDMARRYGYV
jgi:hypothetical protein